MPEEDLVELKFRLYDGSDVGPFQYSPTATVSMLKERIVSEWPKDKKIVPKSASDIKLINAGKILENGKTVAQCKAPFDDLPKSVITMHVVVQLSPTKARPEKKNRKGRSPTEKLLLMYHNVRTTTSPKSKNLKELSFDSLWYLLKDHININYRFIFDIFFTSSKKPSSMAL